MRTIDFSSWQTTLLTLFGLALVTAIGVGIRLLMMVTFQQRRERMNRQINERLRTLIAAYKTLGGSFTGDLLVDPTHRRDLASADAAGGDAAGPAAPPTDRRRRIRDAVEAALSDIILLGTSEQVHLAVAAANDLVAGRPVETAALVSALRTFIREALDLDPLPELAIPRQGPARPAASGARGGTGRAAGRAEGGGAGNKGGGAGGGGAGLGGGGMEYPGTGKD